MKVLNLYAGLGGNRRLWEGCEVTAVENDESIAKFYQDHYPKDTVVVGDAHEYLLSYYDRFDFVWGSTPCPSHSRARFWASKPNKKVRPVYPDMKLYEEILFLNHYFEGEWVVENVVPYYKPLIEPTCKIGRHLFWASFQIAPIKAKEADIQMGKREDWEQLHGISIEGYSFNQRRDKILRNCVHPELGLHIFNESQRVGLFPKNVLT